MFLQKFVCLVRRSIAAPLAFVVLAATVAPTVAASGQTIPPRRYDGVTLVRGLIFADGPVADALAPVRDQLRLSNFITDSQQLHEVRQLHRRAIDEMRRENPHFFNRFRDAMESGDHLRIDASLKEAAAFAYRALNRLPEVQEAREQAQVQPEEILQELAERDGISDPEMMAQARAMIDAVAEGEEPGDGSGNLAPTIAAIALAIYFAVAAHNILVLTAGIFVYFGYDVGFRVVPPTEEFLGQPNLLQEQLVDAIATQLVR